MQIHESKKNKIWFSADIHFSHTNIVKGVSTWENKDGCRNFDTTESMNIDLVSSINKYVSEDDTFIFLGDWSFDGVNNIHKLRNQLNVKDIIFILGNHDQHIMKHAELFTLVTPYLEISVGTQKIILSHFPMVSWNRMYRGSWMLHGHCHGELFKFEKPSHWYHTNKIMDVGVDVAYKMFGEYKPFSLTEIWYIMNERSFKPVDGHDKKTRG